MEFRRLIRLFIIMVAVIQISSAEIILEILFEDYSNPNNWLATHECCYDKLSTCRVSCDNTLSMCVSSDLNKGSCGLGFVKINPKYTFRDDEKRFLQGKDEYRFQNPFNHKLGKGIKEDKLSLDFRVVHRGTEVVAEFRDIEVKVDTGVPPDSWQDLGTVKTVEAERRWKRSAKKLTLKARTKCSNGYNGKYCDVKFCEPRDDAKGHYNCTKDNDKVCLPGWIDPSTNCVMRQVAPSSSTIKTEYSTSIQPSSTYKNVQTSNKPTKSTASLTVELYETSSTASQPHFSTNVQTDKTSSKVMDVNTQTSIQNTIAPIKTSLIIPTKSSTQQTKTSTALKQIFTTTEPVHTTKKTKTTIKTDLPTKQHTAKANQNTGHPTEPYTTTKIYSDSTTEKHLQPTESSQVGKTNTAGNKDKPNRIFEIVFTTLIVVLIALLAIAVVVRKRLIQRNKVHSPDINQMVSKYSENESESTSSLTHEENNNMKSSTTLT